MWWTTTLSITRGVGLFFLSLSLSLVVVVDTQLYTKHSPFIGGVRDPILLIRIRQKGELEGWYNINNNKQSFSKLSQESRSMINDLEHR